MFRPGLRSFGLAACLVAVFLVRPGADARAAACEFDNVERIVAVGDVHGAYDRFLELLKAADLIDERNRWSGGKAHLVQVGDVLDRGPDSLKAMTFLRQLTRQANGAGGKVHSLLGNHEAMRLLGDYRYVTPGEYEAFADNDSDATRRQLLENAPPGERARLEKETPLGMIEMIRAFAPGQDYGNYLRGLNAVVRINGIVFLHGGISPSVSAMTCSEINERISRELGRDFAKTRKEPLKTLSAGEDGPLWYRGLALEPDTFAPEVDKILEAQRASAIVVGHSVTVPIIAVRFGGRVFLIDTGMQPAYQPEGQASALEIRGSTFTAIYTDKRVVIKGGTAGGLQ